jgi:hypothetical protein
MKEYHTINNEISSFLLLKGFRIIPISKDIMKERLSEIKFFMNTIISEYSEIYGWKEENDEYFLNPLDRKFDFSFMIEHIDTCKICFVSISSIYDNVLHLHSFFGSKEFRNFGLGKIIQLRMANEALVHSLSEMSAYTPRINNKSIILFLKMGWQIMEIRKNNTQIYLKADTKVVLNNLFKMLNIDES